MVIYGTNDTRWPVPATNYPPMTGKVSTYNTDGGKSGWISAQLFNITADPLEEHDLKDVAPAALERLNVTFQRLVSIMATGLSCEAQTGPGADSSLRVWREHNDTIGPYINDPLYMYECAVDFCTMVPSAAPSASPVPSLPNPTGSPTVPVPTTVHPSPQPDPAPTARPTAHPVAAPRQAPSTLSIGRAASIRRNRHRFTAAVASLLQTAGGCSRRSNVRLASRTDVVPSLRFHSNRAHDATVAAAGP